MELLQQVRIIDPAQQRDRLGDVLNYRRGKLKRSAIGLLIIPHKLQLLINRA